MNKNIFYIGTRIFGLSIMMMLVFFLNTALVVANGVTMASVVVAGAATERTVRTSTGTGDLDMDSVSEKITEMYKNRTPLYAIMNRIRKTTPIKSFVREYYSVSTRPLSDTVATAYTKSGDGNTTHNLAVDNVGMWAVDDTLLVKGIPGSDSKDLVCHVIGKNIASNYITIQPVNGTDGSGDTAGSKIIPASIPADTVLVRMGAAKYETDMQTTPFSILPTKTNNYCQIFMTQVEESTYQKMQQKEVEWGFSDYERMNIYDMKCAQELSYLFGVKKLLTGATDAKERYFTGGITREFTKNLTYGTGGTDRSMTNAMFIDWTKELFTGNSGSEERVLFGGPNFMASLMSVDTVIKQIEAKETFVKFGLTFKSIETNFGKLLVFYHPLLNEADYSDNGYALDLENIEKVVFKPLEIQPLGLKESGQRNVDAALISEASALICRYPDTHAIIKPRA